MINRNWNSTLEILKHLFTYFSHFLNKKEDIENDLHYKLIDNE